METIKLSQLKKRKETFFKVKADSSAVYIVNHYNREDKTYTCENYENGNERFFKATKTVFIGFTY